MSYAYRARKKAIKRGQWRPEIITESGLTAILEVPGLTLEERSVKCKIRKDIMPKFFFAKLEDSNFLERDKKDRKLKRRHTIARLTWRVICTFTALTKREECALEKPNGNLESADLG